jgi:hypothetical protein
LENWNGPVFEQSLYQTRLTFGSHLHHVEQLICQTDLHPVGGDNVPDVRDHDLREDLVDKAMVTNKTGMGNVFHT